MRDLLPIIIPAMLLAACDRHEGARDDSSSPWVEAVVPGSPATDGAEQEAAHWILQPGARETALVLQPRTGGRIMSLSCTPGENRLQINVPAFAPIGSEDRLSFGSGGEVEALVADFRGDSQLGGVSAQGAVPANLAALVRGPVSASYGAQTSGPHPVVPRDIAVSFVAACRRAAPDETRSSGG